MLYNLVSLEHNHRRYNNHQTCFTFVVRYSKYLLYHQKLFNNLPKADLFFTNHRVYYINSNTLLHGFINVHSALYMMYEIICITALERILFEVVPKNLI